MNVLVMPSPVGNLVIRLDAAGVLRRVDFDREDMPLSSAETLANHSVIAQLEAFFSGQLQSFNLEFTLEGTEFQRSVWQQIAPIPYGKTITYGDIAKAIGKPKSSRAVGAACGQNPISIIVPCHRVIGVANKLTGYGGGLERKAWLLEFERNTL